MTQATSFQLRDYFPCIHLFRAVGIAFDLRKLLLGAIAWIVLAAGQAGIANLPFAPADSQKTIQWPHSLIQDGRMAGPSSVDIDVNVDAKTRIMLATTDSTTNQLTVGLSFLIYPINTIVEPSQQLLHNGNSWSQVAYAWTQLIWAFVVWAFFGVALCRMAAVQFATLDRIRIVEGLRFSARQLQSTCTAPFLPLLAFGGLFAITSLCGLVSSAIPTAGAFVFGVLWIVVLGVGFLMTLLLVGIAITWPLMIATIGSEDSDGFDALSRSFGYLLDRPWYLLGLAMIALVAGSIGWVVITILFGLASHLASWSVASGFGTDATGQLLDGTTGFAPQAAAVWQAVFKNILMGFIPAFFFSASTLIYLLVRQSDDGAPLNRIANHDQDAKDDPPPDAEPEEKVETKEADTQAP
jgi:hypothetical protein